MLVQKRLWRRRLFLWRYCYGYISGKTFRVVQKGDKTRKWNVRGSSSCCCFFYSASRSKNGERIALLRVQIPISNEKIVNLSNQSNSSYVKCETVGSCKLQSYVLRFFFFLIKFSGMFLAQKQLTILWSFITAEFVLNGNFFFQSCSREHFPPIAASMLAKFERNLWERYGDILGWSFQCNTG